MINLGRDGMNPRTYRDLLTMGRSSYGTCVSCHKSVYGGPYSERNQMFSLGTRANICRECCKRKGDEVLGPIAKAERKARHYVKVAIQRGEDVTKQLRFYSYLSGAPESYIEAQYRAAVQ